VKLSSLWAKMELWSTWNRPVIILPFHTFWSKGLTMPTNCVAGPNTASRWACSLQTYSHRASRKLSLRMDRRFDLTIRETTFSTSLWGIWAINWPAKLLSLTRPMDLRVTTSQANTAWRHKTGFAVRLKQTGKKYAKYMGTTWASQTLTSSAIGMSESRIRSGSLSFRLKILRLWCQTQRNESTH